MNKYTHILLMFPLLLSTASMLRAQDRGGDAARENFIAAQASFSRQQAICKDQYEQKQAALVDELLKQLIIEEARSQQAGSLDGLLAARELRSAIKDKRTIPDTFAPSHAGIQRLYRMARQRQQSHRAERKGLEQRLQTSYARYLDDSKRRLTRQGMLELALEVRAELDKWKPEVAPPTPPPEGVDPPVATPERSPGKSVPGSHTDGSLDLSSFSAMEWNPKKNEWTMEPLNEILRCQVQGGILKIHHGGDHSCAKLIHARHFNENVRLTFKARGRIRSIEIVDPAGGDRVIFATTKIHDKDWHDFRIERVKGKAGFYRDGQELSRTFFDRERSSDKFRADYKNSTLLFPCITLHQNDEVEIKDIKLLQP